MSVSAVTEIELYAGTTFLLCTNDADGQRDRPTQKHTRGQAR